MSVAHSSLVIYISKLALTISCVDLSINMTSLQAARSLMGNFISFAVYLVSMLT